MSDSKQRPIIVKRIKKVVSGHHGGAWKIAYADFVTAMMAFFLLMWLLNVVQKSKLNGIAEYFRTPLKIALQGGPSASMGSNNIFQGGGDDVSKSAGEVKQGDTRAPVDLNEAKAALDNVEGARLADLKDKIEKKIEESPTLSQFKKQIQLDITSEGLRIQIIDELNRPMFGTGSAVLMSYTKEILHELGRMLDSVPNRLSLSGHTDAMPYPGGAKGYSNWELSADRANASRRELVESGMSQDKVMRVVGLSSAALFNKKDPLDPVNRRISIIVLNRKTEEEYSREAAGTPVPQNQIRGLTPDSQVLVTPAQK